MGSKNRAICVTLNAAIDRTYTIPKLRVDVVNRVDEIVSQAGGKGNNVARAINRMGGRVLAVGFIGGQNGRFIEDALTDEGIPNDFCHVNVGESRICLTVIDSDRHTATEFIEPGIQVTAAEMQRLGDKLCHIANEGDFVIISGSLPPGCSTTMFTDLLKRVKNTGANAIVDTNGDALLEGTRCNPFSIKPNEHEVVALLGAETLVETDEAGLRTAAIQLHKSGVAIPIVTLGKAGAIACDDQHIYRLYTPNVKVVNTVGSGDSFLGGFVYGLMEGLTTRHSLAVAAGAGAYNTTQQSAAILDAEEVMRLANEVIIEVEAWSATVG